MAEYIPSPMVGRMMRLCNLYYNDEDVRVQVSHNMTPEAQALDAIEFLRSEQGEQFHSLYTARRNNDERSHLLFSVLYELIEIYDVLFPLMFEKPMHPEYLCRVATFLPPEYVIRAVREQRAESPSLLVSYAEALSGRNPSPFTFENFSGATRLVAYIMSVNERLVFDVFREYTRDWTRGLNTFASAVYFRSLPYYKVGDEFEECINPFVLLRRNNVPERVFISCALDKLFFDATFFLLFSGLYRLDLIELTPRLIVHNMTERRSYEPSFYRENLSYGITPETVLQLGLLLNSTETAQSQNAVNARQAEKNVLKDALNDVLFPEEHHPELKDIIADYYHPNYPGLDKFVFSQRYLDSAVWERRKDEFIRAREYYGRCTPELLRMITVSPISYAKIKIDQGVDFSDDCVLL